MVSTHSRPKAAGTQFAHLLSKYLSFNTQPPEGGWDMQAVTTTGQETSFNTQPPEGGWRLYC